MSIATSNRSKKRRSLGPDRSTAIHKEVEELTRVGILREATHPKWVANLVMVKKSDGGWRICVDFTNINKACPKDCYPLPEIDWKVESLSGFCLKCFLDAYIGRSSPFLLRRRSLLLTKDALLFKKRRSNILKPVDKVFNDQVRRNLEAYVDDMVIKSTSEEDMLTDVKETFQRFQSINMKLNQKKCSFGVEEGPFEDISLLSKEYKLIP
nr:reverse transcriptase domain-containing protein [Tanacetum cinerariifolium]